MALHGAFAFRLCPAASFGIEASCDMGCHSVKAGPRTALPDIVGQGRIARAYTIGRGLSDISRKFRL